MKRRRINIILSVFSVIMALSLFTFGVYAANGVSSSVNNTFMFEIPEDEFYVDIKGDIIGCKNQDSYRSFLEHTKDSQVFDRAGYVAYPGEYSVEFEEEGDTFKDIVFSFVVKNYNTYNIRVYITSNTNSTKFSNTPSAPVIIDAYSFVDGSWVAQQDTIFVTTKLTTTENFENESNSFTINFEIVD